MPDYSFWSTFARNVDMLPSASANAIQCDDEQHGRDATMEFEMGANDQQGTMPGSSTDVPVHEPESRATEVNAVRTEETYKVFDKAMLSLWLNSVPSEEENVPKPDSPEGQWEILKNMYRLDWARKEAEKNQEQQNEGGTGEAVLRDHEKCYE